MIIIHSELHVYTNGFKAGKACYHIYISMTEDNIHHLHLDLLHHDHDVMMMSIVHDDDHAE